MTQLRVYIDFKSAAAYLAMQPTLALAKRYDLDIDWRPYKSLQQAIPQARATDQKPEIHRRVRALARRDTHLLYAKNQGLPMNFPDTPGETDLALAALTRLKSDKLPFIQAAFTAYWVDGQDLNDATVVARLLEDSNQAPTLIETLDVAATLEQIQSQALDDGAMDTPAYVIDDQVFIGREHLPWVASLIDEAR